MHTPKVSIVIPCYNVEKYLNQCLDSVINQTLQAIEIICVNDGSKDSTLSIIQEYAATDNRIKIIDKPNGGYGESMNRGFDMATGEYIGIVESDDYVELDMFEKLYATANEHKLDVVKSGFFFYYSIPEEKNDPFPIASRSISKRTFCPMTAFKAKMERVEFFNMKPAIWSAIYRTDFIRGNNIRFNETPGASYQDTSFNFQVWVCAKRVRLMKECFLHYRQDNEASSINSPGKVYCVCDEYEVMEKFLDSRPLEKEFLLPVLIRIKFDSYNWNYHRLSEPLRKEFILTFSQQFKRHWAEQTLQREYFEWYKWDAVHQIIQEPEVYHDLFMRTESGEENVPAFEEVTNLALPAKYTIFGRPLPACLHIIPGGIQCLRDHGLWFTIKHGIKKILRRLAK